MESENAKKLKAYELVAIYSSAPGSGKSLFARYLRRQIGAVSLKFAAPLKEMASRLVEVAGYSQLKAHAFIEGATKEQLIPELGVSGRRLQQTLGTEWGRKILGPDIWVNLAMKEVARRVAESERLVIDDMRFPNEHAAVKKAGGTVIKVVRSGVSRPDTHPSEGGLEAYGFDYIVYNNGTKEELECAAFWCARRLARVSGAFSRPPNVVEMSLKAGGGGCSA